MTTTTTKAMLVLKDGVDAAMERLQEVRQRRRILDTIIIRSEGDENDSGWSTSSEEEYKYDKNSNATATATATTPAEVAATAVAAVETIRTSDFHRLFLAIGQINGLKHLLIDYYANPIPIKAFLGLFRQRSGEAAGGNSSSIIESLEFRHVRFFGTLEDFQSFAEALLTDPPIHIKVCHLVSCRTTTMTHGINNIDKMTSNGLLIDSFLSSLTSLQEVTLEEMDDVPGESLVNLVSNLPRLGNLKLRHIPAVDQSMSTRLADALGEKHELRTLQIRYALGEDAVSAFFRMLQDHPSLETVDIDMDCNDWEGYGEPLGTMLKTNQQLKDFEMNIFGDDKQVEENAVSIAESLQDNDSLRRLCLTYHSPLRREQEEDDDDVVVVVGVDSSTEIMGRLNHAFLEPIADVMPDNFALCELLVGPVHQRVDFCHRTRFFLKLNQSGRKELLAPNLATRKQWVETLITNRDDLDVLFYLLSMNPHLTEHPNQSDTKDSVVRNKRLKRE